MEHHPDVETEGCDLGDSCLAPWAYAVCWMVTSKTYLHLNLPRVLTRNKVFASGIQVRISRPDCLWIRVGTKSNDKLLDEKGKGDWIEKHTEESRGKTEAETGDALPQAKGCRSHQSQKRPGRILPREPWTLGPADN